MKKAQNSKVKNKKIKILVAFGTRPEAIKMAPVIKQFELNNDMFETIICVTAQHREMLDQVLNLFDINPQYDLDLMTDSQTLPNLTAKVLTGITKVMEKEKPDLVIVQGDTTTTFVTSLAAYYFKIPVAHIEAGLRSKDKYSPFPEELNRRLTTHLADIHFSPTEEAKNNLLKEGIPQRFIYVTGNTIIDALKWVNKKHNQTSADKKWSDFFLSQYNISLSNRVRTILVTGHRRESFGEGFKRICNALSILSRNNSNLQIIYPVHLNPNVKKTVYSILGNLKNVHLIPPLDYEPFVFLMNKSYLILTDSGGIQEEAPSLGKPVLVMREKTERPEATKAGTAKIVGTDCKTIVTQTQKLLDNKNDYNKMHKVVNPFGDGKAAERIVTILKELLC